MSSLFEECAVKGVIGDLFCRSASHQYTGPEAGKYFHVPFHWLYMNGL